MPDLLTSAEACDRLGVRPQTLYAYVSRGLLTPTKRGRRSLFPAAQIERLAMRTARGRRPGRFELNIETAITWLDPRGRLLYRGVDIRDIANRWNYERTAQWLWTGTDIGDASSPWVPDGPSLRVARRVQAELGSETRLDDRLRVALTTIAAARRTAPNDAAQERQVLIATLVDSLPIRPSVRVADTTIAARLWARLTSVAPSPARLRALDTALVLFADHELAPSTLAARVAASTWADPYEAVLAGLATVSGALQLGAQPAIRQVLREARAGDPRAVLDRALERCRRSRISLVRRG